MRWAIFILSSLSPGPLVVSLRIPLLMVLDIVHRPDGSLHVLHSLETLVEAQIVSNRVLKEKHISRDRYIIINMKHVGFMIFLIVLATIINILRTCKRSSLIRCKRLSP